MKLLFPACLLVVLFTGCATVSPSKLYWGNYSQTLYQVKISPGEASNKAHEIELQSIVQKSKEMNLRVPPGVYAELGVFAVDKGEKSSAKNYFRLEQETYPEAGVLMNRATDL